MHKDGTTVEHLKSERLEVHIYPNSRLAGIAAAEAAAAALKDIGRLHDCIGVIFATGASQINTLDALTGTEGLPWDRVHGFHMDEYIGIDPDHSASFRRYMREKLMQKVPLKEFSEVNGSAPDPDTECKEYAAKLSSAKPQLCLLGIGENGHLAFNDPDVANFEDPFDVKIVHLDMVCRQQQAAEGWFTSFDEVPESAITLTIPALFRVPKLIVSVPGIRKAGIMRRTLEESMSTACPATILRTHPDATVYLDIDSASKLDRLRFSMI